MTKDDIIKMAREASSIPINTRLSDTTQDLVHFTTDELEKFANLVAAAEREACALIAEQGFRFAHDGDEIADKIRSQS